MVISGIMLAGALIGLGAFICLRELLAPAPPSLSAALTRYSRRPSADMIPPDTRARLGRWLAARIAGTALDVRIPRKNLALVGKTTESYLVQKLAMTVFGLAMPALLWTLLIPAPSWLLSTGFTIVYAAIMFAAPDIAIRPSTRGT